MLTAQTFLKLVDWTLNSTAGSTIQSHSTLVDRSYRTDRATTITGLEA